MHTPLTCVQVVRKLLVVSEQDRMTIEQLIHHPWLTQQHASVCHTLAILADVMSSDCVMAHSGLRSTRPRAWRVSGRRATLRRTSTPSSMIRYDSPLCMGALQLSVVVQAREREVAVHAVQPPVLSMAGNPLLLKRQQQARAAREPTEPDDVSEPS